MIIAAFVWIYLAGVLVSWFFCKELVNERPNWLDWIVISTWCVSLPVLIIWSAIEDFIYQNH